MEEPPAVDVPPEEGTAAHAATPLRGRAVGGGRPARVLPEEPQPPLGLVMEPEEPAGGGQIETCLSDYLRVGK